MEEASENLKILENELKDKRFFGGETIGLVDFAAKIIAYWVQVIQEVTGVEIMSSQKFPVLLKWIVELLSCNVVKETLPPKDKLAARYRSLPGRR